eukprot:m.197353 g.197353  ORF g.197353 m.197353 type:complete len:78 (+) comp14911_c0_seq15:2109-2342(+)
MCALAGGADGAYTFEEGMSLQGIWADVCHMRQKFKECSHAVYVRQEKANDAYDIDFLCKGILQCNLDMLCPLHCTLF